MFQRRISEHVSKLPNRYDAILTSVTNVVLYMRYTNRSWPVKISEVSREKRSMRLVLSFTTQLSVQVLVPSSTNNFVAP